MDKYLMEIDGRVITYLFEHMDHFRLYYNNACEEIRRRNKLQDELKVGDIVCLMGRSESLKPSCFLTPVIDLSQIEKRGYITVESNYLEDPETLPISLIMTKDEFRELYKIDPDQLA